VCNADDDGVDDDDAGAARCLKRQCRQQERSVSTAPRCSVQRTVSAVRERTLTSDDAVC